jgi:hypothetical protein
VTDIQPLSSTRTYLDGAVRVVETAFPEEGRSTVDLWLHDATHDRWEVRAVSSTDGLVGPPVERPWAGEDDPVEVPTDHLPKATDDFDFLTGTWSVHHRRLRERLVGCTEWDEFESSYEARTHLRGLVSIDEGALPKPSTYRGMTFRTFDVAAGEWVLHWFDSRQLRMDATPVRGRFVDTAAGRVGEFVAEDSHQGIPILCRFTWTVLGPGSATWAQAFSTDGGQTWETNHTNTQERVAAVGAGS